MSERTYTYPKYSELLNLTERNYSIAQEYYAARKVIFENMMAKSAFQQLEAFTKAFENKANEFHQYVTAAAYGVLERRLQSGKIAHKAGAGQQKFLQAAKAQDTSYGPNGRDAAVSFTNGNKTAPGFYVTLRTIYNNLRAQGWQGFSGGYMLPTVIGKAFESFMGNYALNEAQAAAIAQYPDAVFQQLYGYFVGNIPQNAWINKNAGSGPTRTDVLFSSKNLSTMPQVELTTELDLDNVAEASSASMRVNMMLQALADSGITDHTNLFGFQLKTYKNFDGAKWAGAANIVALLKEAMDNGETWSSNYAVNYPLYFLSKYLINIINPINIGVLFYNQIIYMDDFLSKVRFYTRVQWKKYAANRRGKLGKNIPASPERGGGFEVFVSTVNEDILMRHIDQTTFGGFYTTRREVTSSKFYNLNEQGKKDTRIKMADIRYKTK